MKEDNMSNKDRNEAVDPLPENQAESKDVITEKYISVGVEAPLSPLSVQKMMTQIWNQKISSRKTQDGNDVKQLTSNTGADISLESDISMVHQILPEHRNYKEISNKENPSGDDGHGSKGVKEIFRWNLIEIQRTKQMTWINLNSADMV